MTEFIVRRLLQALIVGLLMTVILFFGIMVIGNPLDLLVTDDCDMTCRAAAREQLGLDRPLVEQYFTFMGQLLTGNLGRSFVFGTPVSTLLIERLPATLELAGAAMVLVVLIGLPLGLIAGVKAGSPISRLITSVSVIGFSVPSFWVGIVLIWVFSVELGMIPSIGRGETVDVGGLRFSFLTSSGLAHLVLPAITLALPQIALLIRLTQSGIQEVSQMEFVRFARARGIKNSRIVFVHMLRNTLIPIVTVLGLEFGALLAYSLVTEAVFSWPGLGKLLIDSIMLLDRPVVVTYLTMTVLFFVLINLLTDIAYAWIDPRVRLSGRAA